MGRHRAAAHAVPVGVRTSAFRLLTAAWGVSLVGDGVRLVALPLVAALLTRDPLAVTAVAAAELVPWLLLAIPAGALVDRWDARRVVVLAHLARAVITGVLVLALVADAAGVGVLCLAAFTLTVAETFADGAAQVLVVEVTGQQELVAANVRFRSVETLALSLVGPLAGGVLVALDPALAFALDGLTFVVAAALVAALPRERERAHGEPVHRRLASLAGEVRAGVVVLLGAPALKVLVVVMVWTSLASGAVNGVAVLFALDVLGLPTQAVPLLVVLQALGVLAGARSVAPLLRRRSDGELMLAGIVLVGGAYLVVGLVPTVPVVLLSYLLSGVGFALWNVLAGARRQRVCPPELLGRVSNASRAATWGAMPLGALLGGLLATGTSLGAVFLVGGAVILVTALVFRRPLVFSALGSAPSRLVAPA